MDEAGPAFSPLKSRVTVQEHVFRELRKVLMAGAFDPEQVLTITALAKSFGVSHMPVREALRRLAAENALEQMSSGSLRVPAVSHERLDDLVEARLALEPLATERAASAFTPERLEALREAVAAHENVTAADGVERLLECNREVHFLVYTTYRSAVIPELIEALWLRFGPYLKMLSRAIGPRLGEPGFNNGAGHHRALLAALEAGDARAARAAMEADIRTTHALLAAHLDAAKPG